MNIIEVRDLNFSFGKKKILKDINLEIKKGERTIIIGPNGCGKTTLLRIMSGYLEADSGQVLLGGRPLGDYGVKEKAQVLAMQHQSSQTAFDFSVEETVSMARYPFLDWKGSLGKKDREIVNRALDLMSLRNLASSSILEISGGEKGRVMSARAFAQDAGLILMDEPVSAMDLRQQINLMNIIEREEKLSFILVLHDLNLASQYADKIILMKEGKIVARGEPAQVLTQENINSVYQVQVEILKRNDRPYVIPCYKDK